MKILHISDIHGRYDQMPPQAGEILAYSGDLTRGGTLDEVLQGLDWMASWPAEKKFYVPGNHDYAAQVQGERVTRECRVRGIDFLVDRLAEFGGWRFWGHPWVEKKREWNWPDQDSAFALTLNEEDPRDLVNRIPPGVDVLISHGPARGLGDSCGPESYWAALGESSPGSSALRDYVDSHRELKLILSGHVHENPGAQRYGKLWCVNAACSLAEIDVTSVENKGLTSIRSVRVTPF